MRWNIADGLVRFRVTGAVAIPTHHPPSTKPIVVHSELRVRGKLLQNLALFLGLLVSGILSGAATNIVGMHICCAMFP